jgi:hypothetical protein
MIWLSLEKTSDWAAVIIGIKKDWCEEKLFAFDETKVGGKQRVCQILTAEGCRIFIEPWENGVEAFRGYSGWYTQIVLDKTRLSCTSRLCTPRRNKGSGSMRITIESYSRLAFTLHPNPHSTTSQPCFATPHA